MKNYTFTTEQLYDFMTMTNGMMDYQGSQDTFPLFDEFCEKVLGDDWSELMCEWDCLFEMEFDTDPYYYLSTGNQTEALKDWIEQGKEILSQILAEQE